MSARHRLARLEAETRAVLSRDFGGRDQSVLRQRNTNLRAVRLLYGPVLIQNSLV